MIWFWYNVQSWSEIKTHRTCSRWRLEETWNVIMGPEISTEHRRCRQEQRDRQRGRQTETETDTDRQTETDSEPRRKDKQAFSPKTKDFLRTMSRSWRGIMSARSWLANEGGKHLVLVGKSFTLRRSRSRFVCFIFGTSRSKWALHIVYSSVDKNKKKTKTKNAELKLLSNLKFYSSCEYNQLFTLFYGIGVRFQGQLKNHNRQQ